MAGLDPAIHVFLRYTSTQKTWMPGTKPGGTKASIGWPTNRSRKSGGGVPTKTLRN
jgi:hypothetical protein